MRTSLRVADTQSGEHGMKLFVQYLIAITKRRRFPNKDMLADPETAQFCNNGDTFNLEADHSAPTANEGVSTSEVSVITKEGAVVINGAAGKKVTISNVLGQTIANTVTSSDNATINVPAGVVIVAVEGEAAVKAIVK